MKAPFLPSPSAGRSTSAGLVVALACAFAALGCGKDDEGGGLSITCPANQMACGAQCLSVSVDPLNCGGCGVRCASGEICQAGACMDLDAGVSDAGDSAASEADTAPNNAPMLVTSAPNAYWSATGALTEVAATAKADVTVNETTTAQTWEGFGGSFNEMGWSYLSLLSPTDRDAALHLLYGADGARFAFGRIPIGASDYAMDRYTLDETPNDVAMANFSIERDKTLLIPFVKAAQAINPRVRFWASPWTPPTWMKKEPFSSGKVLSAFDGGTMKDDDATMGAYALYLVRFVQEYAKQGITVETVSAQNEPGYQGNYPTCGWSPETYVKFIGRFLGPTVASSGLTTKIMLGTFNGGGQDASIINTVLGDATARGYISVLGLQWNTQDKVARAKAYNLPAWQSEHKCGNYPWETSTFVATQAPNDQAYAVESWGLIRDWIHAGVTAYNAWNMVLDTVGNGIDTSRVWPQDSLLTVDMAAKTLKITPTYWVFRHISQFVPTGAKVVGTSGGDALAFKNPDGSVVTVLYNSGAAKTMTVAASGKKLQFAMPANGWATIVSR